MSLHPRDGQRGGLHSPASGKGQEGETGRWERCDHGVTPAASLLIQIPSCFIVQSRRTAEILPGKHLMHKLNICRNAIKARDTVI